MHICTDPTHTTLHSIFLVDNAIIQMTGQSNMARVAAAASPDLSAPRAVENLVLLLPSAFPGALALFTFGTTKHFRDIMYRTFVPRRWRRRDLQRGRETPPLGPTRTTTCDTTSATTGSTAATAAAATTAAAAGSSGSSPGARAASRLGWRFADRGSWTAELSANAGESIMLEDVDAGPSEPERVVRASGIHADTIG